MVSTDLTHCIRMLFHIKASPNFVALQFDLFLSELLPEAFVVFMTIVPSGFPGGEEDKAVACAFVMY